MHTMGYLCEGESSLALESTLRSTFCLPVSLCFPSSPKETSVTTVHVCNHPQILLGALKSWARLSYRENYWRITIAGDWGGKRGQSNFLKIYSSLVLEHLEAECVGFFAFGRPPFFLPAFRAKAMSFSIYLFVQPPETSLPSFSLFLKGTVK